MYVACYLSSQFYLEYIFNVTYERAGMITISLQIDLYSLHKLWATQLVFVHIETPVESVGYTYTH